ncbi:hypothetical protein [Ruegeria sp.]|uniref:hypothetical protein n=1 Tax=Ruegeria sp. TaxID=1879320 RepID=UPI003B598A47
MPGPEAWEAAAGVGAVLIFISAVVMALRRMGVPGTSQTTPAAPKAAETQGGDLHALEREIDALRLHVAEHYVRREDYVSNQSRIIGMLESHSTTLARLEERIGRHDT